MNPYKQRFRELWKEAQKRGWTQAELARKLDMSPAGISGIITGEENTSAPTVRLFEMVLRVDLPDALILRDEPTPYGSTEGAKLAADLDKLAPEIRDDVIQGMRKIVAAYGPKKRRK